MSEAGETDDLTEASRILGQAARRTCPDGTPVDFAEFLAQALAATAANLGGPDCLLAGRPGSWEAGLLESLLYGTLGDKPQAWLRYRTEPIVVPLNVAELVEDTFEHPGLLSLYDAFNVRDERYEAGTEDDLEAYSRDIEALEERYEAEFEIYGRRFSEAVEAHSATYEELGVEIRTVVDKDPSSEWWTSRTIRNPSQEETEDLVVQLWTFAHDTVPLPNVDVALPAVSNQMGSWS